MNTQPIATARDADLRLSVAAMQRASMRAREVARQTGTAIVISQGGVVQQIELPAVMPEQPLVVQEPPAPYRSEP